MIVVTQEMGFTRHVSSPVIVLHNGGIEEQGTPAEVLGGTAQREADGVSVDRLEVAGPCRVTCGVGIRAHRSSMLR